MYKTINGWTKETMIQHIKTNFTVKSIYDGFTGPICAYRGEGGAKCAVGVFIKDEDYAEWMDDLSTLTQIFSIIKYLPLSIRPLKKLQVIHDKSNADETLSDMLNWVEHNVESN